MNYGEGGALNANNIRNVALVGHGGSGKTSLNEAILFLANQISRLGKTDDGNTVSDYEPEEIGRKISISTALSWFEHKKTKINLLDTPGFADFIAEVMSAIKVADCALFVLSSTGGVEVQADVIWNEYAPKSMPKAIFINKMDKENANFFDTLNQTQEKFGRSCVPVQLPIGQAHTFTGIVDLINMKTYSGSGKSISEQPIPDDMSALAGEYRDKLFDVIAEKNDALLEKYLEGEEPSLEEIIPALAAGFADGTVYPVFCGSATMLTGVQELINSFVDIFPAVENTKMIAIKKDGETEISPRSEDPPGVFIFKTISDPFIGRLSLFRVVSGALKSDSVLFNITHKEQERFSQLFKMLGKKQEQVGEVMAGDIGVVAKLSVSRTNDTLTLKDKQFEIKRIELPEPVLHMAVHAKAKADEEKLSTSMAKLIEEDPTLKIDRNYDTHETVISGMGEIQLDVMLEKLKRKYGVESYLSIPKLAYKETVTKKVKVQGKYKKQSGGRGQYGDCWIEVEPLERGKRFEFVDKIFGGAIPQNFRPAVEKGILDAMSEGIISKSPVTDIKVTLVDGSYHSVDSSEMAFKIAGSMALKAALQQGAPIILEPIDNIEITLPSGMVGDIIGDLNSRRGKVLGMEPVGDGKEIVKAQVPIAELLKYSIDLRSMSGGRARFKQEFSHYSEVPSHLVDKVAASIKEGK